MYRKQDLANDVVKRTGLSKKAAKEMVDTVFDIISNQLNDGEDVDLYGFGRFSITNRKARMGMNPGTKERIEIPASKNVKFKAASLLKYKVNN